MNKTIIILAFIGILFGIVTVISGGSVLSGANPGYLVFLPLVIFNSAMGFAYILTGIVIWKNSMRGKTMTGIVFLLNFGMLIIISYLYLTGNDIASQSLAAISFRTIVWLIIYVSLAKVVSKQLRN